MGKELRCRVEFGKKKSEGKAMLESSEIVFRGDFRLKIPFSTIQSAKVVNGELELRTPEGVAKFELGPGTAEKWCGKILHPKTRIEKLGIKTGARVVMLGFSEEDQGFLEELDERTKMVSTVFVKADTEWVFLKAETKPELKQLSKIAKGMRGVAAVWVVYPKRNSAEGQKITEGDVLSAGRGVGLKDVKVVGFSATHTALKFVIPVSQR
ncbi:MAG: hypothetical protein M3P45_07115 [Acidobacteriota bacterium]|nr:hypothetical protein [Acidobacteriota bacterium]